MGVGSRSRPSLLRPSMFAAFWHASTWCGLAVIVVSLLRTSPADVVAMGPPLLMIAAVVALSELRPIVMSRLAGNPVSISLAFVFAALYLWGLYPAVLLLAGCVVLSELLQRKALWRVTFNVGQYVISLSAAWVVLLASGVHPTPTAPATQLSVADLGWIVGSWIAFHLVNLALVAGLAGSDGETWWDSFSDEFWFYTVSAMAVLALSPLVAVVAVAAPSTWTLLPLLLLPLLAVQKAAEMSRQREHQALHDPLTGLPNRLLLTDRITQALARSSRSPGRVVVLFLDIDMFKVVNDGLGHAAGDALLVEMAARLRSVVRPGDTLARFGGDEFVIVCDDAPTEVVDHLAGRVREALSRPFSLDGRDVTATASIGIAVSSATADAATLLRDADAAMYRAKAAGRNQAVVFDAAMHEQAAARLEAEFELRRALHRDELRVHFQPILDLRTDAVVGLEALVRWQHPTRGLLGPAAFVGVAEETGLIVPMGEWVLSRAVTLTQEWRRDVSAAEDLWVSVNLSARQLSVTDLPRKVRDVLVTAGLPPSALHLEITESVVMDEFGPNIDALRGLRALGVRLAVDDFGTGYSSLGYLKRLPVSTVKIDRSFVDGLGGDDPSDPPIVDAIISMARALGLDVVAEGVETPEQLATLRRLGAARAQGFLWSGPLPAEEVPQWLCDAAAARVRRSA